MGRNLRKRAIDKTEKVTKKQKLSEEEKSEEKPSEIVEQKIEIVEDRKNESLEEKATVKGTGEGMRIISWNVAGLYAAVKKDFCGVVKKLNPDVMCIQETKTSLKKQAPPEIEKQLKDWKYRYYNDCSDKKGYSGVGILSKTKPLSVQHGMGVKKHDGEGRSLTAEYDDFYLVTTYVPNSGRGLVRLDYRCDQWDTDFRNYLNTLSETKPVILCGDLNVAHTSIDLKNDKSNYNKSAGYTQREIDEFEKLLGSGFEDSYRTLYPDKEAYTYWTYMGGCRAKNVGWRLDYFMLQGKSRNWLEDNIIHSDVMGSDHCPIELKMKISE